MLQQDKTETVPPLQLGDQDEAKTSVHESCVCVRVCKCGFVCIEANGFKLYLQFSKQTFFALLCGNVSLVQNLHETILYEFTSHRSLSKAPGPIWICIGNPKRCVFVARRYFSLCRSVKFKAFHS